MQPVPQGGGSGGFVEKDNKSPILRVFSAHKRRNVLSWKALIVNQSIQKPTFVTWSVFIILRKIVLYLPSSFLIHEHLFVPESTS